MPQLGTFNKSEYMARLSIDKFGLGIEGNLLLALSPSSMGVVFFFDRYQ